jgi:transposase
MCMGKAHSEDLRLHILKALDGGMSKMQAHKTFGVSRSTIDDWLRLRDEQGHVRDKPPRHLKRGALSDEVVFGSFADRYKGTTLRQMAQAWEQETGQRLSRNTFSIALRRLNWTRKKRVSSTASATPSNVKLFSSKSIK